MQKETIVTENAPAAVGPYSQAIKVGHLVYTAGQVAIDPATGKLIDGDIKAQTDLVLRNLRAVLEAAGSSLADVVKTTVFLNDIGDYAAMNEVYAQYFSEGKPARSAFAVDKLPLGALIEIEAVGFIPD